MGISIMYLVSIPPPKLLRNSDGADVSPTQEGGGGEQETLSRGKSTPSTIKLTVSDTSTTSAALLKKEEEVRADCSRSRTQRFSCL